MIYAKIIVKNEYARRGDLVLRQYIRAVKKINAGELLDGDNALIYGTVDEVGRFHELLTGNIIDYNGYVVVPEEEYNNVCYSVSNKRELLTKVIEKLLFNQDNDLKMEFSTMEELARDRAIEFDAYDKHLSRVNPYQRVSLPESDCNNFLNKIKEINKMRIQDSYSIEEDEYEVKEYIRRPNAKVESEFAYYNYDEEDEYKKYMK